MAHLVTFVWTDDRSVDVSLEFRQKTQLKYYRGDKYYPKHTQAILTYNGIVEEVGTVIKHHNDPDNLQYAMINAARKALRNFRLKDIRKRFWDQILMYNQTK